MLSGYLKATAGPLAHCVNDCTEFFKIQCHPTSHFIDPLHHPTSFNQQMYDKTLMDPSRIRVGILSELDCLPVTPPVKRAMQITRDALEKAGYQVVNHKIDPRDYARSKDYMVGMIGNGTFKHLMRDWDS